jgi:hypothetical protein
MKEETTELLWSEDLWAQVGEVTSQVRTQRRGAWRAVTYPEGCSKRSMSPRDVGDRT